MMGAGGSSSTMTPMAPIPDHCICREVVKERYIIIHHYLIVIPILCIVLYSAPGVFLRSTHLAAPLNVCLFALPLLMLDIIDDVCV